MEGLVPEGNGIIDKSQTRIIGRTCDCHGGWVLRRRAKLSVNRVATKTGDKQEEPDGAFHFITTQFTASVAQEPHSAEALPSLSRSEAHGNPSHFGGRCSLHRGCFLLNRSRGRRAPRRPSR
jgi:hypothetical protein